jgi:hypothetical protein
LASYDRSVNGALCPFLSLVLVHCGDLIGGSFPDKESLNARQKEIKK